MKDNVKLLKIDPEVLEMLREMAKADDRTMKSMAGYLIKKAYKEFKEDK